jgi:hypothetical protein
MKDLLKTGFLVILCICFIENAEAATNFKGVLNNTAKAILGLGVITGIIGMSLGAVGMQMNNQNGVMWVRGALYGTFILLASGSIMQLVSMAAR